MPTLPLKPTEVRYAIDDLTSYFTTQADEAATQPRNSSFSESILALREQSHRGVLAALQAQVALGHDTVVTARPLSDGSNLGEPGSMFFEQLRNGEVKFIKGQP